MWHGLAWVEPKSSDVPGPRGASVQYSCDFCCGTVTLPHLVLNIKIRC